MLNISITDITSRLNSLHIDDHTTPSRLAVEDVIEQYEAVVIARVKSRGIHSVPVGSDAYRICRLVALRLIIAEIQNLASANATSLSTELYDNTMKMLDDLTERPDNLGEPATSNSEKVGSFKSFGQAPPLNPSIARYL